MSSREARQARQPGVAVRVLHRDEHLLVLDKPSGIATTGPGGGRTLVDVARELDPDAPLLHPSSRLDAEVSGIVTFARTHEAIAHLLSARRAGRYERGYLGVASGRPDGEQGEWCAAIGIDPRDARKRCVVDERAPGARTARSLYRVLAARDRCALLWLAPQTGRTHQLRLHAAHAGVALYGDRPYGGPQRLVLPDGVVVTARRTLLHCCRVSFPALGGTAPALRGGAAFGSDETLRLESPVAAELVAFWNAAGGAAIELP